MDLADLFKKYGITRGNGKPKLVKTYDYADAAGNVIFQVCRMEPKSFRQRRPDGKGGWIWSLQGITPVLYRLPEVIKAEEVLICEGEKDADTLAALGLTATTCPMGAEKWRERYNEYLKGKRVVIIPDNDDAGRKHLAQVARSLVGAGIEARVVHMPDGIKDVSDFAARFKEESEATERLAMMIDGAEPYKPSGEAETEDKGPQGITAAALIRKVFSELMWVVCGVLSQGLWILAGKPKHGKSILAANVGVALSIGGRALGAIPVDIGTVIYLALEDTQRRLQKRLQQMLSHGGRATDKLIFFTEWPRMDQGGLELLEDVIKSRQDTRVSGLG
jgi:5S rRNA maturation endonuclease (ribonuclease M5)